MTDFAALGLAEPLLRALTQEGYTTPTPIQAQAIPHVLAGRDLLGIAQTGTGKTAAFALPVLHHLADRKAPAPRGGCRALILSPTRELASQIHDNIRAYGRFLGLSSAVIFGGVGARPQVEALRRGVDVLVATPGRLQDHVQTGAAKLQGVEVLVLDEADQMLDRGFWPAVKRLSSVMSKNRQTLFFSATMPAEIAKIASEMLKDPAKVSVTPVATTAERIEQKLIHIDASQKRVLLSELLRQPGIGRALVFARTKHGADRVTKHLNADGIAAHAIHGDRSQGQRERALAEFRTGRAPILVATDIASRGIDVDGVTHVFQFDLPDTPEAYVHRIGRTARAGASGEAIAFCAPDEVAKLKAVEKLIAMKIPAEDRRSDAGRAEAAAAAPKPQPPRGRGRPQGQGQGRPPAQAGAGRGEGGRGPGGGAPRGRGGPGRAGHSAARKDRNWRDGDFRDSSR
ncbi:DEAD/DEAH box helicase [Pseudoroseomonas cervicalis]|uniref:DEAD/DEAH box helicase n=1 Tax=Teichococcus cervicalis TaxID=204525 RepID=UPI00278582AA|nr:DEAD/DEAH box helicase [Pseudoroseomonas cervicalis]MDQ1079734.1 ATP-dependent RNA helicase RhlE [Pseudoroseomonas cervicalis]